jgi:HK97 family phage portal protein
MTSLQQIFDIASPSEEFLRVIGSGISNDTGIPVSQANALNFTAVSRAIRALANPLAAVSKHFYESSGDMRERLSGYPAQNLISRKANGYTTAFTFFRTMQIKAFLWGNAYAKIIRDGNYNPVALNIFDDGIIKPTVVDGQLFYVNKKSGEVYDYYDVLHIKDYSTNGIEGMSRISQYRQGIGIGLVSEKFQAKFFGNGTISGGIVEIPESYEMGDTPEEELSTINKLRKQFNDQYSGPDNAFKVMFMDPGMKFQAMTMPLKDAEFLMSRKFQVVEVARMFDCPLSKLFDLDRATTANSVEHQGIEFVQESLLPWSTNWEMEINDKLVRESDKNSVYCKFNLDSLIRADIKTRYEAHSISLGQRGPGWRAPEEIRTTEDLNPIDPGKLFKPMNFDRQNQEANNEV